MHIGAAEIRHILICMGELVTDEEVQYESINHTRIHKKHCTVERVLSIVKGYNV